MGPYGAASQGKLGTFAVPRHRLHKPGPKVSIFQVMTILEIQAGYVPKLVSRQLVVIWVLQVKENLEHSQSPVIVCTKQVLK